MSCPDWRLLARAREADPGVDPPGWDEARAHLRSCPGCRREALAADPLLLFQRLAATSAGSGPEVDEDRGRGEILAMQQGVAALVRASRVAGAAGGSRRRRSALPRVAAAAAFVFAVLALDGAPAPDGRVPSDAAAWLAASAELPDQPLIDELDLAQARVYELGSDGVAVVMVVDATLDV